MAEGSSVPEIEFRRKERERERERERGGGRERIAFPQKASLTDLCAMLPFMFVWSGLGVLSSLPSSFFLPQRDSWLIFAFPGGGGAIRLKDCFSVAGETQLDAIITLRKTGSVVTNLEVFLGDG